ncbi:hypothetical protein Tco_1473144 [Tanacetum coccineum]
MVTTMVAKPGWQPAGDAKVVVRLEDRWRCGDGDEVDGDGSGSTTAEPCRGGGDARWVDGGSVGDGGDEVVVVMTGGGGNGVAAAWMCGGGWKISPEMRAAQVAEKVERRGSWGLGCNTNEMKP